MARTVTSYAKPRPEGSGEPLTDEQKAELDRKWRRFAKHFNGRPEGSKKAFLAHVIALGDPEEKTDFKGKTRNVRVTKAELLTPGIEGLRFQMDMTDNGATVQNENSALNHLYIAVHKTVPPQEGAFEWDPDDLMTQPGGEKVLVMAVIQKGAERPDGQRGGFYANLRDFEGYFPEPTTDDDDNSDVPF